MSVPEPTPVIRARPRRAASGASVQWTLPGFAPMSAISCSFGDVPAAALRERDMVRTRTGGFAPIVKVTRSVLDQDFLRRHADALPIRIRAHALGPGAPETDILVSPAQLVGSLPGRLPQPRRAGDLLSLPGVFRQPDTSLSYTQIRLARAAEVRAHGLWFPAEVADSAAH